MKGYCILARCLVADGRGVLRTQAPPPLPLPDCRDSCPSTAKLQTLSSLDTLYMYPHVCYIDIDNWTDNTDASVSGRHVLTHQLLPLPRWLPHFCSHEDKCWCHRLLHAHVHVHMHVTCMSGLHEISCLDSCPVLFSVWTPGSTGRTWWSRRSSLRN